MEDNAQGHSRGQQIGIPLSAPILYSLKSI
jgi:hypothetical protein